MWGGFAIVPLLQILCGVAVVLWMFRPYHSEIAFDSGRCTILSRRPYLGAKKTTFECSSIKGVEVLGGGASKWVSVWLVRSDGSRELVVGGIANDGAAPPQIKKVCEAIRDAGIAFTEPTFPR
jgi:hypothetical protein